jgi:hypothetical protein
VVKYNDLASDFGAIKNIIIDSIIFWKWYIINDLWSMIYNQYDILSKHIYPIGIWKNGVNTHLHCIGICWWSTFGGLTDPPISMTRAEKPGHNTWTQLLSYRSLEERTKMHWTLQKLWMGLGASEILHQLMVYPCLSHYIYIFK